MSTNNGKLVLLTFCVFWVHDPKATKAMKIIKTATVFIMNLRVAQAILQLIARKQKNLENYQLSKRVA